ncbi:lasso peptide biosynthesis B2 protein [Streptomyces sp. SM12]|uniref:lasso peptide biosynthesis B2 protein n=1 Tax=Streptomyces sp. SM12 TaxID=1071602 RepID=UPI000CD52935|nr:lasso peptide biosynthesis B2 protein [Streptomyces sp. SM12]
MTTIETWEPGRAGPAGHQFRAWLGLLAAVALLRLLPFRYVTRTARLARRFGRRPMFPERAEAMVDAVRWAGRRWPVRVACMETSLGAVLACALAGERLTWCVGARVAPPVEYHAWASLPGGGPVREYTRGGWHYLPALKI